MKIKEFKKNDTKGSDLAFYNLIKRQLMFRMKCMGGKEQISEELDQLLKHVKSQRQTWMKLKTGLLTFTQETLKQRRGKELAALLSGKWHNLLSFAGRSKHFLKHHMLKIPTCEFCFLLHSSSMMKTLSHLTSQWTWGSENKHFS